MRNSIKKILERSDKAIILFLASIVLVSFLVILALAVAKECAKSKNSLVGYLRSRTNSEQVEHLAKTKKVLLDVERDFLTLGDFVSAIASLEGIEQKEKKEFLLGLRKVEEEAILLNDSFSEYFDDISVQYSPFANSQITSFVYESRNLSIALQRFVRQAELVLLGSAQPAQEQGELLTEQYYEVVWYLNELAGRF